MSSRDRETMRQLMLEAATLPGDDPSRQEIERTVASAGEWAQQEWTDLLRENSCLREQLQQIEIPVGLEERLLALPDATPRVKADRQQERTAACTSKRPLRRRLVLAGRWLVAAVALCVLCAFFVREFIASNRLQTVALLAINNHVNHIDDPHLSVETEDAEELTRSLAGEVAFEVIVPALDSELRLVGGRKCKLGTHPVVFSLWAGPDGLCSLFQFRASDFGLPSRLNKKLVPAKSPAVADGMSDALIWTQQEFGYVLVNSRKDEK